MTRAKKNNIQEQEEQNISPVKANINRIERQIRRTTRNIQPVKTFVPSMKGKSYEEVNHLVVQSSDQTVTYDEQYALVMAK